MITLETINSAILKAMPVSHNPAIVLTFEDAKVKVYMSPYIYLMWCKQELGTWGAPLEWMLNRKVWVKEKIMRCRDEKDRSYYVIREFL